MSRGSWRLPGRGQLTGRRRLRAGWFGRLVLQVEFHWRGMPAGSRMLCHEIRWRDARVEDGLDINGVDIVSRKESEDA